MVVVVGGGGGGGGGAEARRQKPFAELGVKELTKDAAFKDVGQGWWRFYTPVSPKFFLTDGNPATLLYECDVLELATKLGLSLSD